MRRILPLSLFAAGIIFGADQITSAVDRVGDPAIEPAENPAGERKSAKDDSAPSNDEAALPYLIRPRRVEVPADPVRNKSESSNQFFDFEATAYCLKGRTASGHYVQPGVIAADPRLLPLGTVVELQAGSLSGLYTVLDTGGAIKGSRIDIYMPNYTEAMSFGRRTVKLRVIHSKRARVAAKRNRITLARN